MAFGSVHSSTGEDEFAPPLSEINVTPLVDVMLVLLIIFMVAAPLMTIGVPIQLPRSAAEKVSHPKRPVVVTIDRAGQVYLDKELLLREMMVARLRALAAQDGDQVVLVRGDQSVSYGRIMEIMGDIGAAGLAKVSLISQAPSPPATP